MALSISVALGQTGRTTVDVPGSFTQRITKEIKVTPYNTDNDVTFTFAIIDKDGVTRYSISALPETVSTLLLVERIVKPGYKFGITPSGAPGNAGTVSIDPEYY